MADLKMPDLNVSTLAGRLTRDPDLKYTNNGNPVCSFAIAITRHWTDKSSKKPRDETIFVDCECWANLAEWLGTKIKKGAPVLVQGHLAMDEWDDKATGQKRRKIYVRADRVQTLSWDGAVTLDAPKSKLESLPEAPGPDEDIPF